MEDIIKSLEEQVKDSSEFNDGPDEKDWGMELGILISRNEAIRVLESIKKNSCADT